VHTGVQQVGEVLQSAEGLLDSRNIIRNLEGKENCISGKTPEKTILHFGSATGRKVCNFHPEYQI